jgi:hypothetical protein
MRTVNIERKVSRDEDKEWRRKTESRERGSWLARASEQRFSAAQAHSFADEPMEGASARSGPACGRQAK